MKHLLLLIPLAFLSFNAKDNASLDSGVFSKTENCNFESNSENIKDKPSEILRTVLYSGTLNGTIAIRLYLNEQEHPCGGDLTILNAMYKYDTQEKWLLLSVTTDRQKEKYCLVEDDFSGVLFLEEKEDSFNGNWVSPDTKKKFQVELKKVALEKAAIEKLDDILFDDLLYGKNDC